MSANAFDDTSQITWEPVQPKDTHCFDVLDVSFDCKSERTSEGRDSEIRNQKLNQAPNLWQKVTLRIAAWPRPKETLITITNVIHFSFVQFEFAESDPIDRLFEGREIAYHVESLASAGFNIRAGVRYNTHGAFCLWVCQNSPLVSRLALKGSLRGYERALESQLRHFELTCDDLGTFHFVGSSAEVVATLPSPA